MFFGYFTLTYIIITKAAMPSNIDTQPLIAISASEAAFIASDTFAVEVRL